ncbi:hypothetical protein [Pradoshia sp.]
MRHELKGHELNMVYDMKALMLKLSQACLDELPKEGDKKIQITTSHCSIIADKLHMNEPDMDKLTLLERSILEEEDTFFPLMNEGKVNNLSGMLLLRNVKIIPFAAPDKVIEIDSYALYTDHIMGFSVVEED